MGIGLDDLTPVVIEVGQLAREQVERGDVGRFHPQFRQEPVVGAPKTRQGLEVAIDTSEGVLAPRRVKRPI